MTHEPFERTDVLNARGDYGVKITGAHGTDISSSRLGEIDIAALKFVLGRTGAETRGLDIGCGLGVPSIAMALIGADMTLVDVADFTERFQSLAALIPTQRLTFLARDVRTLTDTELPSPLNFVYSQRTIHYMPYPEALALFTRLYTRLEKGGMVFISGSGMHTELSEGYPGVTTRIQDRFFPLAPQMAEKHDIRSPICLYTPEEFETLFTTAGFRTVELFRGGKFGNVKGVFIKD